jgi:hypothetical protein
MSSPAITTACADAMYQSGIRVRAVYDTVKEMRRCVVKSYFTRWQSPHNFELETRCTLARMRQRWARDLDLVRWNGAVRGAPRASR